eukprot:GHVR01095814.1.p1 GENE.GHVR01095814.1~~GHVR01095814.1.p1  ORF type:complete len:544 (+),score=83.12 GHVR01095814.1:1-1632(+)
MFIGHEPQKSNVGFMCGSLYLMDMKLSQWMHKVRVNEHDAYITRLHFKGEELEFMKLKIFHDKFMYEWDGRIFVMADTHGDYDTVVKVLKEAEIVHKTIDNKVKWIASDTLLIQLGDVIDRGPYSEQSMILFDNLREQAEEHNSKVILLMGDHEYFAATDYFNSGFTERDSGCYGGLKAKKELFSSDENFHRKYVKTLKVAVVVNGIFYSHAALNKYSIEYACDDYASVNLFPEKCLRDINKEAQAYLPTLLNNYYKIGSLFNDTTNLALFNRVSDDAYNKPLLFCEQHKQFIGAFGASVMIIGHEPQMEIVEMCESLYLVDTRLSEWMYDKHEKEHDASITSVQFKLGVVNFNLFPLKVNIKHETFVYEWEGPIFALGDVHGDFDTVVRLLIKAEIIDDKLKWIASNTLLIQLGDVIDRGPYLSYDIDQLIRLFSDLRESAEDNNSKVILLMGNNEYSAPINFQDKTSQSFGGLKRNKLFSDSNGFYRKYVKSLKMAVMVNGMLFSHNVFIKDWSLYIIYYYTFIYYTYITYIRGYRINNAI